MNDVSFGDLRRLRVLIDQLPALIGYWDSNLRNVIANDAYRDYFGLAPADVHGRHIREVLGEAVYTLNLPYIEAVLGGQEQLFDRTLIDSSGMTRYTQASYVPDFVGEEVVGFYVLVTDVTARVEAEQARDEAVRLLEVTMANAPFGEAVLDMDGYLLRANPALCQLLGYSAEQLIGADLRIFNHPDDLSVAESELATLKEGSQRQVSSERRYIRSDRSVIWVQRTSALVAGAPGCADVIVAQFQDVTARRDAEAQLARLAVTDTLTGLRNRHALIEHVSRHRAQHPQASTGLIFADLDGFKSINDSYGHIIGDAVLAAVAHRIGAVLRQDDSAYRLGGDEFVVVTLDAPGPAAVKRLAAAVQEAVTGSYDTGRGSVRLAASVGATWSFNDAFGDVEELLHRADADMYRNKSVRRSDPG